MSTYKKYTHKRTVPMPVAFTCRSCRKSNIVWNPFTVEASYNDKGTYNKNVVQEREKQAMERLDYETQNLYDQVSRATQRKRFKNAGYVCRCAHCNSLPLWSNYRMNFIDLISVCATIAAVFFALICFLNDFPTSDLMTALKIFVFGNLPGWILYTIKGIRVRCLKKECLPVVFKSAEHLQQTLAAKQQQRISTAVAAEEALK